MRSTATSDEADYLLTAQAVRDRAEAMYTLASKGELEHFTIDESQLPALARRVVEITRAVYPDVRAIPYHARWRHFGAGNVDRVAALNARLSGLDPDERLGAKLELVITSVLLDAGAGELWRYTSADGTTYRRSEGLAVASFDFFTKGGFSSAPETSPLRADGEKLARITAEELARGFQVSDDNPLPGLEGRAALMRNLGRVVDAAPNFFGGSRGRVGALGMHIASNAVEGTVRATTLLTTILDALNDIWPGRQYRDGRNLGDVWTHPQVGLVPFHKLSQWLAYSFCEPLEESGITVSSLADLTGLAEYRNGGLFIDGGVLLPKNDAVLSSVHGVGSTVVVEWRALTIALLDRIAEHVRRLVALSAAELPLARVLEGGTWRAGRILASERRPNGEPPIRVRSDGTVF